MIVQSRAPAKRETAFLALLCVLFLSMLVEVKAANAPASTNAPAGGYRSSRFGRDRAFITDPPHLDWSHLPDATDAERLMTAYNRAFYVRTNGTGYFRGSTTSDKAADFWKLAEEIEMVIDVCEHARNAFYSNQIVELINGFDAHCGAGWTNNVFNDDVIWICIANLRGYQLTGNTQWRDHARAQFDAVYRRAWDTNCLGGGLFWKTENLSKNTCVNAPAAIAACLLWKSYGETEYRDKANAIIDWVKTVLSDGHGWIYDSIRTNGTLNRTSFTYNQGTFIGACNFLGRTREAAQAADFVMQNQGNSVNGFCILPARRARGDIAGFNGIFFRWMARYMQDQHLESTYLPWLQANALSAWSVRRSSDNLSWSNWMQNTPADATLDSWACSPSVVALHALLPSQ
jgi:predicted alpha-1,6-mannanase (GH76 family)